MIPKSRRPGCRPGFFHRVPGGILDRVTDPPYNSQIIPVCPKDGSQGHGSHNLHPAPCPVVPSRYSAGRESPGRKPESLAPPGNIIPSPGCRPRGPGITFSCTRANAPDQPDQPERMTMKSTCLPAALLLILASASAPLREAPSPEDRFPLLRMLPQGIYLVGAERDNPDRAFISRYWQRVLAALKKSGFEKDLVDLIQQPPPQVGGVRQAQVRPAREQRPGQLQFPAAAFNAMRSLAKRSAATRSNQQDRTQHRHPRRPGPLKEPIDVGRRAAARTAVQAAARCEQVPLNVQVDHDPWLVHDLLLCDSTRKTGVHVHRKNMNYCNSVKKDPCLN